MKLTCLPFAFGTCLLMVAGSVEGQEADFCQSAAASTSALSEAYTSLAEGAFDRAIHRGLDGLTVACGVVDDGLQRMKENRRRMEEHMGHCQWTKIQQQWLEIARIRMTNLETDARACDQLLPLRKWPWE